MRTLHVFAGTLFACLENTPGSLLRSIKLSKINSHNQSYALLTHLLPKKYYWNFVVCHLISPVIAEYHQQSMVLTSLALCGYALGWKVLGEMPALSRMNVTADHDQNFSTVTEGPGVLYFWHEVSNWSLSLTQIVPFFRFFFFLSVSIQLSIHLFAVPCYQVKNNDTNLYRHVISLVEFINHNYRTYWCSGCLATGA